MTFLVVVQDRVVAQDRVGGNDADVIAAFSRDMSELCGFKLDGFSPDCLAVALVLSLSGKATVEEAEQEGLWVVELANVDDVIEEHYFKQACEARTKARERHKALQVGSRVHGTLNPYDLLPVFIELLSQIDAAKASEFLQQMGLQPLKSAEHKFWRSDECAFMVSEVMDELNRHAYADTYFGSHPGDGSDFGFWPAERSEP